MRPDGFYRALRERLPEATLWLLVSNIGVFLLMAILPPVNRLLFEWGAAIPALTVRGQVWRLVSYMFLHAGGYHLLSNMLGVYFFAQHLEHFMGTRRFTLYYFACGVGAGLVHTLTGILGGGAGAVTPMVGASGAIYGVLFAMAYYFPNQTVYINFLIPMKMKYLVIAFGVLAFIGSVGDSGGGISHITHLGGLLTGMAILLFPRFFGGSGGRGGGGGVGRWLRRRRSGGRVERLYDAPHWRMEQ